MTNQSDEKVEELHILGMNFGIIFQILDDLLDYDVSGNTGKEIGQDFYDGKISIPIILLIEKSNTETYKFLKNLFALDRRTTEQLEEVIKLLEKYQINKEVKSFLDIYVDKSEKILNNFKNHESEMLKKLIKSSMDRCY